MRLQIERKTKYTYIFAKGGGARGGVGLFLGPFPLPKPVCKFSHLILFYLPIYISILQNYENEVGGWLIRISARRTEKKNHLFRILNVGIIRKKNIKKGKWLMDIAFCCLGGEGGWG